MTNPPRHDIAMQSFELGDHAVVDWFSFCREVCLDWWAQNSSRIGGPGSVVEIDEAKIGKRKYNRGRWLKGYWIFGGYERTTKTVFVVQVPDRTRESLFSVIHDWILPGTTIISDCWRSYSSLDEEGFTHLSVNHSVNFVDPDTGAHTNGIERVWREVRAKIPRYGTRKEHAHGHLAEFIFKLKLPNVTERIHNLFSAISSFYTPPTHI